MPWSGSALARMREALGYSGTGGQAAAAKKAGRAATQLSEWEGDATRPRVDVLVAYIESLGGSMHDLADALDEVNGRPRRAARLSPLAGEDVGPPPTIEQLPPSAEATFRRALDDALGDVAEVLATKLREKLPR